MIWLPRQDSNLRMPQSKCGALPLGYEAVFNTTFFKVVEGDGFEPSNPKEQIYSLPRLATSLPLQKWCRNQDLNPEPTDYKSVALPIELFRHYIMVGDIGLEPMTPCL